MSSDSDQRRSESSGQHRNDIYGNLSEETATPAILAATVVLLCENAAAEGSGSKGADGFDVLMLRKNSKIAFGGMWVFPGGRLDPEDYPQDGDVLEAARTAAAREAKEEAGVDTSPQEFVWFAHWSPPPSTRKRFATWFFATVIDRSEVQIDGGEIQDHAWISPREALERHARGEIDLAPPTWVTLYHLARSSAPGAALRAFESQPEPRVYATHVGERSDGVRVAMWRGDAGYETWDADLAGPRHRLVMARDGFVFEHEEGAY